MPFASVIFYPEQFQWIAYLETNKPLGAKRNQCSPALPVFRVLRARSQKKSDEKSSSEKLLKKTNNCSKLRLRLNKYVKISGFSAILVFKLALPLHILQKRDFKILDCTRGL